jgi:nondiscriminating aspartyl-tRNA synthetase
MKNRIPLNELGNHIGEEVDAAGYVNSIRDQKRMQFLILRDRTGLAQATNEKGGGEIDGLISSLTPESTVDAHGQVIRDERVKLNQLELKLYGLEITSQASTPLPITKNSSLENRLDWRYIDLRRPENRLIFDIQTTAEHAMRTCWLDHGFTEIHSPKLLEGATESGAELFQLDYFGKKASLAQSPQFYKQMAMASGFERVFEIGPVFRANPSFTSRHDTEFTSVDMEMSWIDSHEDVMEFEENWLQYVLGVVEAKHGKDIKDYFDAKLEVPEVPFPRVSMDEAYRILEKTGYRIPRSEKRDLDPEGERRLSRYIKDNFGHEFVFVTDYPVGVRPFYHMRHEDDPDTTKSFDLIWKGVEVTTGAQREHRYDTLLNQALEKGIDTDTISHYLNFFRYGCPPHGGYGFGLTRMLMMILDAQNVREVTFLYRGPNRLTP